MGSLSVSNSTRDSHPCLTGRTSVPQCEQLTARATGRFRSLWRVPVVRLATHAASGPQPRCFGGTTSASLRRTSPAPCATSSKPPDTPGAIEIVEENPPLRITPRSENSTGHLVLECRRSEPADISPVESSVIVQSGIPLRPARARRRSRMRSRRLDIEDGGIMTLPMISSSGPTRSLPEFSGNRYVRTDRVVRSLMYTSKLLSNRYLKRPAHRVASTIDIS